MKEIAELDLPDDVRYAEDHEWAQFDGNTVRVGLSDYAQDQLGDIVFIELPAIGENFSKGDVFGTVESVKTVAELYMPVGGGIRATNKALENSPELVNQSPYSGGWLIEIKPFDSAEVKALMSREVYVAMLKGIE